MLSALLQDDGRRGQSVVCCIWFGLLVVHHDKENVSEQMCLFGETLTVFG